MLLIIAPFFLIVSTGGIAGFFASSSYLRSMRQGRTLVLTMLIVLALATAVIPYIELYDLGISTSVSFVLEGIGYFLFSFSTVGAWMFLSPSRIRWLLLALVPVSFAKLAILTMMFINWAINGYHP